MSHLKLVVDICCSSILATAHSSMTVLINNILLLLLLLPQLNTVIITIIITIIVLWQQRRQLPACWLCGTSASSNIWWTRNRNVSKYIRVITEQVFITSRIFLPYNWLLNQHEKYNINTVSQIQTGPLKFCNNFDKFWPLLIIIWRNIA